MIIGMTGSGKTFLAEKILQHREYVVVYDLKGEIDWRGYQVVTTLEQAMQLEPEKYPKLIFKPDFERTEYGKEQAEEFFKWVYKRRNCTLYVDEVMSACYRGYITYWLQVIMTRGRELNISFIGSTQRPKSIPMSMLSESQHWAIFHLSMKEDADRVEKTFGIETEKIQALPDYHFYYGSVRKRKTINKPMMLAS